MSENSLSTSASGVAVLTKLNVHATKSSIGEQNISDGNDMVIFLKIFSFLHLTIFPLMNFFVKWAETEIGI